MAVEGGYGAGSFARLNTEIERSAVYFGAATGAARTFVSTLSTFTEFDRQLRLTNSVADGTAQTFAAMRDAAISFSTTTTTSATEAAQAMYFLASAGYSVQQSIQAMNGVLLLSQATMADTSKTADLIVATLNQYGLSAAHASEVADIFTASITTSQATLEKLQYAMRQVGPVAGYMGQSVRETTAWLDALFQSGLRGEQAGTALRNILLRLVQPTQNAASIMRTLGVDVVDPLTLKFSGLKQIMEGFTGQGLTAGTIKQLVGDEASAGFKILLRAVTENKDAAAEAQKNLAAGQARGATGDELKTLQDNAEKAKSAYEQMYDALDPEKHTSVRIAVQNMEAFGNQMKVARNEITAFAISVGETMAGALSGPIHILGELGDGFTKLSRESQSNISSFTLEAAGLALLVMRSQALRNNFMGLLTLQMPQHFKSMTDEVSKLAPALQGAASGLTKVSASVSVPGVSTGRTGTLNRMEYLNMFGGGASPNYSSELDRLSGTTARERELGQDYYRTTSRGSIIDTRPGQMGFVSNAEIDRRVAARVQQEIASLRASVPVQTFPVPPTPTLFERAAGIAGTVGRGVGGAIGATVGALGGPVGALITAAAAADIGKMIADAVSAYLNRNVVHEAQASFAGIDKMIELTANLLKQNSPAEALSTSIGTVKATQEAVEQIGKRWRDIAEANVGKGPLVEGVVKSWTGELKGHGVSDEDIDFILKNRTFSRGAGWTTGIAGEPVYNTGERIRGTEGLDQDKLEKELDYTIRLKEIQGQFGQAVQKFHDATVSFETTRAIVGSGPTLEQVQNAQSKEEKERLIRPFTVMQNLSMELEKLEAEAYRLQRSARGDPQGNFEASMSTLYELDTKRIQVLLGDYSKNVQTQMTQLAQVNVPGMLGLPGTPGVIDIARLHSDLLKEFGGPMAAQAHSAEIQARILEALNQNIQTVFKGAPEQQVHESEVYQKIITPLIEVLTRGFASQTRQLAPGQIAPITGSPITTPGAYGVPGAVMNYGSTGALGAPGANLTQIETASGLKVTVNKAAADAFKAFLDALEAEGYKIGSIGGYAMRNIAGTDKLSEHAYGAAIDINPAQNPQGGNTTNMPADVQQLAARYGLIWGGLWSGKSYDPMHFQYGGSRPDLVDPNSVSRGPAALTTASNIDVANQQGNINRMKEEELKIALQILETQTATKLVVAERELKAVEMNADDFRGIALAKAKVEEIKKESDVRKEALKAQYMVAPPNVITAQQDYAKNFATQAKLEVEQNRERSQRDVGVNEENLRRQREIALLTARSNVATSQEALAIYQQSRGGAVSQPLGVALINVEQTKLALDYAREIDAIQKQIVDLQSRSKQTPENQKIINELTQEKAVLEQIYGIEQKRLSGAEALAKAMHDEANAANERYKSDNQYTGGVLEGFTYAAKKNMIDSQDEMFRLGVEGFKGASDKLGTAFAQALQGKVGQAKQTLIQWESDLATMVTKAAFNRLLVNPLLDLVLGKEGGANSGSGPTGSSGGLTGSGGSGGGGLLGSAASLASGEASRGIFGRMWDSIFGTSTRTVAGGGLGLFPSTEFQSAGTAAAIAEGGYQGGFLFDAMGDAWMGGMPIRAYAKGGVIRRYASGEIFDTPTSFPMADGGTGLLGEAGPEAIMPLRRTASGRLGIEMAGGGGHTIHYNPNIAINLGDTGSGAASRGNRIDPRQAQQLSDQIHRTTQEAVLHTIRNEQRPGGMLFNQSEGLRS